LSTRCHHGEFYHSRWSSTTSAGPAIGRYKTLRGHQQGVVTRATASTILRATSSSPIHHWSSGAGWARRPPLRTVTGSPWRDRSPSSSPGCARPWSGGGGGTSVLARRTHGQEARGERSGNGQARSRRACPSRSARAAASTFAGPAMRPGGSVDEGYSISSQPRGRSSRPRRQTTRARCSCL